ncbi:hypothetical protein BJ684DRAFT_14791 [Piptocephalis cylindrospora]|uniref:Mitochondrial outer membrane transport complex Sam37/metaxin N-terminal domain-containing protein n=1 Tax=Piptocephalis cylindrospora TaxID=1907219 RepID=A0A4P9Y7C6_9FUNG|nr:hypothetical protein BJ684DRAFT_14791 [Piptocephalis cylindrospora]|eukprot:RKP14923.1 hypothetical protein BJ684DRAFT_14791 [Piptocephalis cylindrospora]
MSPTPPLLELFTWSSHWGLPTHDPECLAIATYLALGSVPWAMDTTTSNPHLSSSGLLPVLRVDDTVISGPRQILGYLDDQDNALDRLHLSPTEQATSKAYRSLVGEILLDATKYLWYKEDENYAKVIRPLQASSLPLWTRWWTPIHLATRAREKLAKYDPLSSTTPDGKKPSVGDGPVSSQMIHLPRVYEEAQKVYTALARLLGENDFFFGDHPSSLDAIVYAHLSVHLVPLPDSELADMLNRDFPSLVQLVSRVKDRAWSLNHSATLPSIPAEGRAPSACNALLASLPHPFKGSNASWIWWRKRSSSSPSSPPSLKRSPEEREVIRQRFLSVVGGVTLMLAYVIWHGIGQGPSTKAINQQPLNEEEEEDDDVVLSF